MSTQILSKCTICGGEVAVPFEPTGDPVIDKAIAGMAGKMVHDKCAEDKDRRQTEAGALARLENAASDWSALCPPLYRDSDEWVRTEAAARKLRMRSVNKALEWQFGSRGLFLFGQQSGKGKTTSAWVVCKREFRLGRFVCAASHVQLSDKATALACGDDRGGRWAATLRRCDLLFVDDFGKSRFKGRDGAGRAAEEFVFDLVDHRAVNNLPTILTSNFVNGDAVREAMSSDRGEAFVRRLQDFFVCVSFDSRRELEGRA